MIALPPTSTTTVGVPVDAADRLDAPGPGGLALLLGVEGFSLLGRLLLDLQVQLERQAARIVRELAAQLDILPRDAVPDLDPADVHAVKLDLGGRRRRAVAAALAAGFERHEVVEQVRDPGRVVEAHAPERHPGAVDLHVGDDLVDLVEEGVEVMGDVDYAACLLLEDEGRLHAVGGVDLGVILGGALVEQRLEIVRRGRRRKIPPQETDGDC